MKHIDNKNWAAWLFLPDLMIMQRITDGRVKGNGFWSFLLKYLLWFLIGEAMCMLALAVIGEFKWMYVVAGLAAIVPLSVVFAAFSHWHVKDSKYFKEKYSNTNQKS